MSMQIMRIGIAADHEGFVLEAHSEDSLITSGHEVGSF